MSLNRAVRLDNGTIFSVISSMEEYVFEFEDGIIFEVIEDGYDEFGQVEWKRTGKNYTPNQINALVKL